MDLHDIALIAAGSIGIVTAIIHGVLTQRLMVAPLDELARGDKRMSAVIRRIVPMLLHYSTVSWLLSGVALIGATFWADSNAKFVAALFVGAHFLYGAIGNCWATHGRHPGWMLMAAAVALIAYGVSG